MSGPEDLLRTPVTLSAFALRRAGHMIIQPMVDWAADRQLHHEQMQLLSQTQHAIHTLSGKMPNEHDAPEDLPNLPQEARERLTENMMLLTLMRGQQPRHASEVDTPIPTPDPQTLYLFDRLSEITEVSVDHWHGADTTSSGRRDVNGS